VEFLTKPFRDREMKDSNIPLEASTIQ